jgi:hypothetical protein
MHYSLLNFNYFFLFVDTIPEYHKTLVKSSKWLSAAFQEEVCAQPRNVLTNKRRAKALTVLSSQDFYKLKRVVVKRL